MKLYWIAALLAVQASAVNTYTHNSGIQLKFPSTWRSETRDDNALFFPDRESRSAAYMFTVLPNFADPLDPELENRVSRVLGSLNMKLIGGTNATVLTEPSRSVRQWTVTRENVRGSVLVGVAIVDRQAALLIAPDDSERLAARTGEIVELVKSIGRARGLDATTEAAPGRKVVPSVQYAVNMKLALDKRPSYVKRGEYFHQEENIVGTISNLGTEPMENAVIHIEIFGHGGRLMRRLTAKAGTVKPGTSRRFTADRGVYYSAAKYVVTRVEVD